MTFFKRAGISIKRKPVKSVILMMLVFVLGNVIAGVISIHQAVAITGENLRSQLPAVATIVFDHDAWLIAFQQLPGDESPPDERVTPEMIREVGELPYVEFFDYHIRTHVYGRGIIRYTNQRIVDEWEHLFGESMEESATFIDWGSLSSSGAQVFERVSLKGVQYPGLLDIREGIIELVDGRTFTEDEIESGAFVTMVSQGFLEANNLRIGSIIELENNVFDNGILESLEMPGGALVPNFGEYLYVDDNIFATESYAFEIIGTFAAVNLIVTDTPSHDLSALRELENQLYIPNQVAEQISLFNTEQALKLWEVEKDEMDPTEGIMFDPMFILNDPRDLNDFARAANEILPGFHVIGDLTNRFDEISSSMESLQELALGVLRVGIGAAVVILGLLIMLFIRDRKHEIGIYLSLGETKVKVVIQILLEMLVPAIIGITLALFAGSVIANTISQNMVRNEVVAQVEQRDREWGFMQPLGSDALAWISAPMEHLTAEEMLEHFNVNLNGETILMIYGAGILVILLSTALPLTYAMRLDPKKILLYES